MIKNSLRILLLLMMLIAPALAGCSALLQPVQTSGSAPTPVVGFQAAGTDDPNVFVDPAAFQKALLQALAAQNSEKLRLWMAEPFISGTWRMGVSNTDPNEALKTLYREQLTRGNPLSTVAGADLKALMGGAGLPDLPNGQTVLVSGWGLDGRDEAVLFMAREANNRLKWHGWMRIQGGFSGARLGGIQPYQNEGFGFSLYLPKDSQVSTENATEVMILAPGEGHPDEHRAAGFIFVEPANRRSVEQLAAAVIADQPPGLNITRSAVQIENATAIVVSGLSGQDVNRQVFMVHQDVLYKLMFIPANPSAPAYQQMEDIYAMVMNTFHFLK